LWCRELRHAIFQFENTENTAKSIQKIFHSISRFHHLVIGINDVLMSVYVNTELAECAALATRLLKSDQIIKSSSMSMHASIRAQGTTQGVLLP
jgi:hypothetical protein